MSDCLQTCGLQPASLLCPWNSLGKNTGVGCHALLQGILPFQGLNSSCMSPALAGRFFTTTAAWEAPIYSCAIMKLLSFVNLCKLSKDTHTHIYMYTHTHTHKSIHSVNFCAEWPCIDSTCFIRVSALWTIELTQSVNEKHGSPILWHFITVSTCFHVTSLLN